MTTQDPGTPYRSNTVFDRDGVFLGFPTARLVVAFKQLQRPLVWAYPVGQIDYGPNYFTVWDVAYSPLPHLSTPVSVRPNQWT